MAVRSYRVSITDLEGITHTVEVTASTLYEAVALGLVALRGNDWVAGLPEGLAPVRVTVAAIPVEHTVRIADFARWVEWKGGSPREMSDSGTGSSDSHAGLAIRFRTFLSPPSTQSRRSESQQPERRGL